MSKPILSKQHAEQLEEMLCNYSLSSILNVMTQWADLSYVECEDEFYKQEYNDIYKTLSKIKTDI